MPADAGVIVRNACSFRSLLTSAANGAREAVPIEVPTRQLFNDRTPCGPRQGKMLSSGEASQRRSAGGGAFELVAAASTVARSTP